ncbi:unnamed protein product [Microthlaspi erraticum]|uniref:Integrase catalytic domain-containing protein n=1 Tax=Microthlaspi erraticum TaxID=1685480 RepID=A0A6D2HMJ4_9BRAS|nr:unnamed protein product [Microthlaspi erraticum]
MVIGRKVTTRRGSRSSTSARRASIPEDSPPGSPIAPDLFSESIDSIHSPFHLTSGDNPGISLISEVLDGSNFDNWRIAMNIALDAKNKLAFVDGSLPRPSESHRHFRIWSRCNSMVKSWLLNSVSKQIYRSILRFNDASEIWKDLLTRFHITNLPRSYQLSQQIWSLQQGSNDLATYYTKLKTLWDELDGADCVTTCGSCDCCKATSTKSDHAKVIKFLAGLNDSYGVIRSQIIMKKHIPELSEVYNLLDQDHSQRSFSPVQNATAFQMTVPDPAPSSVNAASAPYRSNPNRPICSHCGYNGHTIETCYKIHGYPIGFKHKSKQQPDKPGFSAQKPQSSQKPVVAQLAISSAGSNDNKLHEIINTLSKDQIQGVIAYFNSQLQMSPQQNAASSNSGGTITALPGMAFSSSTLCFVGALRATGNALSSQSWIIDSGATHHVCHDKNLFVNISDSLNRAVTLPTGIGVEIAGIGTVKLNASLVLNNVLFIPHFRLNLLSISQLTKDLGYRVVFDESSCMIQDHTKGLMIGQGDEISNLYVQDTAALTDNIASSYMCSNIVVDLTVWHNRLGHPAMCKTDFLKDVLGVKQRNKDSHCAICPLAKQKHIPFVSKHNICEHPFDLLHIDTWGPFSVPTAEGYRYFLTIVDDHTRVTWVYLMRTKDEVLTVFPEFLKMVETQYHAVVKGVRSDNAPELKFASLFKQKGIVSYHSCPETPEQNSVVERKHQHILNVARALMFQAHVPLEYWSDCVLTAVFLINRLPTPLLNDKSPYEVLTTKPPDYSGLRVFGCLAYCSSSSKHRHKFQPRAKSCAFLGYPAGCKGYKLLDLESNTVHVSRNVVFHEEIFPFSTGDSDFPLDFFNLDSETLNTDSPNMVHRAVPVVEVGAPTVENINPTHICSRSEVSNPGNEEENTKRASKRPAYLEEYYCHVQDADIPYPLANFMSYGQLSDEYRAYICALTLLPEPVSFKDALKFDEWIQAMNEELMALEKTDTWDICSLPPDKHAIGCKWVYKLKLLANGCLERYKARLMTTVKTLLAVSAAKNWSLKQLDISNAFLNGELEEEIYMTLPPGYTPKEGVTLPPNAVCKLKKSLYGLKQASRQWFLKFSSTLLHLGFKKSHADHTLFIKRVDGHYIAALVYVDDIIIASNNDEDVQLLVADLQKAFKLRDLGELRYFLGLEIARSRKGISICQRKYTLELLEETGMLACKPSSIPMDPSLKLALDSDEPVLEDITPYRRLVGKMMYLTITRPHITYAVNRLCTIGLGVFYSADSDLLLKGFTDADWNSCTDSRRSTSGFCMFLGPSLISWKSKKQQTSSHSSAESEYRAMEFAVREISWLVNLLTEFDVHQPQPVAFYCDSTAAIHIANNAVFHERTKHIENDCHIVRDRIVSGLIKTLHIRTETQLADVFTKPLYPTQFQFLIGKMSLLSIYPPS